MDLSGHLLEKLQEDSGVALYRARSFNGSTAVLVRTPISQALDRNITLRLERELTLKASLNGDWALLPRGTPATGTTAP